MIFSRSPALLMAAVAAAAGLTVAAAPAGARPGAHATAGLRCRHVANVAVSSPSYILADHSAGKVYVSSGSNAVSVISMRTDKVIGTITVNPAPWVITPDPADGKIYVVSTLGADGVTAIGTRTDQVLGFVAMPGTHAQAVYPPDHAIYASSGVGNNGAGTVYVISTKTDRTVGTIFVGQIINRITPDPQTSRIYVSIKNDDPARPGLLAVINPRTNKRIHRYPVTGDNSPNQMLIDPKNRSLYVDSFNGNTISVFSTKTNAVTATIKINAPQASTADEAIVPSLGKLFVADGFDNAVSVISLRTNKVIATLHPKSQGPAFAVGADQATGTVFVADAGEPGALVVVNARTDKIIATEPTGGFTDRIAIDPATNTVYAVNENSNTVTVVRSCP